MALKDRIRSARLAAGLNKSELARLCEVDPSAINHLENGRTKSLSGDLLLKIANATGVDPFTVGGVKKEAPVSLKDRQEAREHKTVKHLVDALATLCAAHSDKVVDLLTGYLWDESEASSIKSAHLTQQKDKEESE